MVNQRKVEVCMGEDVFEFLDEIHCGLEDGMQIIEQNIARIKGGTGPPIKRAADFFRCALDNIDSAMASINAFEPAGFDLAGAVDVLEETRPLMNMIDEAERRGHFNTDELRALSKLVVDIKPARVTAFEERARLLTKCLLS